ncbi:hypothetical protein LguiB_006170 [Lonicera macranthoides]
MVTGLPSSASWQDLKIRKLDDSMFRNSVSKAYIKVEKYDQRRSVSPGAKCSRRSLSRSRLMSVSSRARSESYPPCSISRSRSRSRSPLASPLLAASGLLEAQCASTTGAEAGVFLGLVHLM